MQTQNPHLGKCSGGGGVLKRIQNLPLIVSCDQFQKLGLCLHVGLNTCVRVRVYREPALRTSKLES